MVHDIKGRGRVGTLVACYLIKLWQCPSDYAINHLRLIRPASIETDEQENVVKRFHSTAENGFEGVYSRIQQVSGWDNKTVHLGQNYDSLLATLPTHAIQYSPYKSGDNLTNQELAENRLQQRDDGQYQPMNSVSQDYQLV